MAYKSETTLLGLPLVHITLGGKSDGRWKRGIAKGWIAIGDIAFGVLLSIGGIAFGGVALGGIAFGVVALAGLALGVFSMGGAAIGIFAIGGAAIALHSAIGGLAVAMKYAEGGGAFAEHANDPAAKEYFENTFLFRAGRFLTDHAQWLVLLAVIPIGFNLRKLRRKRDQDACS
jgi:hypothetical protein